jgi:tripartite-type tricarboxylate transporter receptor subunit TctC
MLARPLADELGRKWGRAVIVKNVGGAGMVIGATLAARSPDVPTVSETGLPGFRSLTWFVMVGPPGFEPALADKINRDLADSLRRPEVNAILRRLMLEPMIGSPADAATFLAEEAVRWGRVIKEGNVAAD